MSEIPFVIDNESEEKRLSNVLNDILSEHQGKSLDIASAYFNVFGYKFLKDGLDDLGSFRLLLGYEPNQSEDIGVKPDKDKLLKQMQGDLEDLPFGEDFLILVEDLIRLLRKDKVAVRLYEDGFLHAKSYLFYHDKPVSDGVFDRYMPYVGIVGSSNFTRGGLSSNKELNLVHKAKLSDSDVDNAIKISQRLEDPNKDEIFNDEVSVNKLMSSVGASAIDDLSKWYQEHWTEAHEFKDDLIELLDTSKFGEYEYTPYQLYMKTLFTYLKDDLESSVESYKKSVVELTEFQEDAVKKARKILMKYSGVMIADSVGLGKTWIAKKLLEDYAYHMRQKVLIVPPASLKPMWKDELNEAGIPAQYVTQEKLGRKEFDPSEYGDVDVVLIDESHNFRNSTSQRYENMERIISMNGGRGRGGNRKVVILLTATPINNGLMDLYNQLRLITQNEKDYFSLAGIGDLRKYFLRARRKARDGNSTIPLFNLLEEIVVRRSRTFIKKAYPEATIGGNKITWPERELGTLTYDLEDSYSNIYKDFIKRIEDLKLAPYSLENYKRTDEEKDDMEIGREMALIGIFKTRFLKRFESSVNAFRISIRRSLEFLKTFEDYLLDGKLLDSSTFRTMQRFAEQEREDDDATPKSLSKEFDTKDELKDILKTLPELDIEKYDLKSIHQDIQNDIDRLTYIWNEIKDITYEDDEKLQKLKVALKEEFKGKKLLIFSYYKDTEQYLYNYFTETKEGKKFIKEIGDPTISRLDSDFSPSDREHRIQHFSPKANDKPELSGSEEEIDIMFSTDVLSEGQNLQDCGYMLNYDLHWNPMRMVQRAGRIDRIGSEYEKLYVYNFFPEDKLEELLGIVNTLNTKIQSVNGTGFHDASILGEEVNPKEFNTLRRIRDEDGTVFEEEEEEIELASNEMLKRVLIDMLESEGRETIEELPDGIHSGRKYEDAKGVFFYFTLEENDGSVQDFWKYYDLQNSEIIDNRYIIANYISCNKDEPRVAPDDVDIFTIKEEVKNDILSDITDIISLEEAPKKIESEQQTVISVLQDHIHDSDINRNELLSVIRSLENPLANVYIKELRNAYKSYTEDEDFESLLEEIKDIIEEVGYRETEEEETGEVKSEIDEEDLHLVCFEYIT